MAFSYSGKTIGSLAFQPRDSPRHSAVYRPTLHAELGDLPLDLLQGVGGPRVDPAERDEALGSPSRTRRCGPG